MYILDVAGLQLRNFLKMGEASRLGKKGKSLTARHFSFWVWALLPLRR